MGFGAHFDGPAGGRREFRITSGDVDINFHESNRVHRVSRSLPIESVCPGIGH